MSAVGHRTSTSGGSPRPCASSCSAPTSHPLFDPRRKGQAMWDFSTEPEYEKKLRWAQDFVCTEIYPLETLGLRRQALQTRTAPLKQQVKDMGLWACHLGPE